MTLGNKFPESLIRIDYTRYDDCYRIRRALSYFYGVYFCFIPASLSCFARYFYAFLFLWTAGMLSAMLRKGTAGVCASLLEEV